jgi:hypothetical protein
LAEKGTDVNKGKDGQYGSLFVMAIQMWDKELVEYMISRGADTNANNYKLWAKSVVEVRNKVQELTQGKDKEGKIEAIFDRIYENIIYDWYGFEHNQYISSWIIAYQKRFAVCEWFSNLFEIMLRLAGITDVIHISGTAGSNGYGGVWWPHARNAIGEYYYDVTRGIYKVTLSELNAQDPWRQATSSKTKRDFMRYTHNENYTRYVPENPQYTVAEFQQKTLEILNSNWMKLVWDSSLNQIAQNHSELSFSSHRKNTSRPSCSGCSARWWGGGSSKTLNETIEEIKAFFLWWSSYYLEHTFDIGLGKKWPYYTIVYRQSSIDKAPSYKDPFQSNTSDITPSYEDPFQSTNTPHTSYTTPLFCESQRDGNFEGCVFWYEVFDAIATQACTRVHGKSTVVPRNWDTYVARAKARWITEVPFHTSYSYWKNSTISLDSVIQAFASQGLKASSGEAREKYEKGELREEAVCF